MMFEFEMIYTDRDNDPYYYTNWDRGSKATVLGETREQAFQNLWAMLGPAPSRHRHWVARVLSAKQVS